MAPTMWVNLPGGIPKVRVPWVDLESILPHDHVQVDTALEYACLGVATALALLVLWLWYEIEASPVFEAQLLFRARRERGFNFKGCRELEDLICLAFGCHDRRPPPR